MAGTLRWIGNGKLVAVCFAIAVIGTALQWHFASVGFEDSGSYAGGIAAGNVARYVYVTRYEVAPGEVLVVDLTKTDASRCSIDERGVDECRPAEPGRPRHHPLDETARFYITESGDAQRVLDGQPPLHSYAEMPAPQAWRQTFRLQRPPVPSDVQRSPGDFDVGSFNLSDVDPGFLDIFWVVENRTGAAFAAARGEDVGPFSVQPTQIWIEKAWYKPAKETTLGVTIVAAVAASAAAMLWIPTAIWRRPSLEHVDSAEKSLEALAREGWRLHKLLRSTLAVGGLVVVLCIAGTLMAFWFLRDSGPEAAEHQSSASPEPKDLLLGSLAIGTGLGILLWAAASWLILMRVGALQEHLARAPEF